MAFMSCPTTFYVMSDNVERIGLWEIVLNNKGIMNNNKGLFISRQTILSNLKSNTIKTMQI